MELEIESSDRLNPDDQGRSLPTQVRLLQLSDLSQMQAATFRDVWTGQEDVLKQTLVAPPIELTVYPGQIVVQQLERSADANYLVGMGVFTAPVGTSWRTVNEWPLTGDPCNEQGDETAAPKLERLRVRMFLQGYQVASTNDYAHVLPRRSCPSGKCAAGNVSDELADPLRNRRLRTFEEDPSAPRPTTGTAPVNGAAR